MNHKNILSVRNLYKIYGRNREEASRLRKEGKDKNFIAKKTKTTLALWDVNLDVKEGEIFVVIGMSGSGKSTLVRCFNLLNRPTKGNIYYRGEDITNLRDKKLLDFRRDKISMVFQNFGLMSHRNILENVEYGLEVKGVDQEERRRKAEEVISMVGLEGYENEAITSLSGGMKQRVGLARALANDSEILLMDEPFSALDPLVKKDMQFELLQIQRRLGKTIIFITHDMDEAFKLGDTVAIMKDGAVVQVDTPEKMSTHPADDYVRQFIDSADKSQILTVRNVMSIPNAIIHDTDSTIIARKVMRNNKLSSLYVVNHDMEFKGIVTLDGILKAEKEEKSVEDVLIEDIATTTEDCIITDIMDIAIQTPYPLPVLEKGNQKLKGIVTRADVLSSLQ